MQKFLKDWVSSVRIRSMLSMIGRAREPEIKLGCVETFLSKTPAFEPLRRPDRFRPELNPVKVLKDMMGEGSEETWQWQGEPEGERELLRTRAQWLPLKNAAQLLGSNRPSGR